MSRVKTGAIYGWGEAFAESRRDVFALPRFGNQLARTIIENRGGICTRHEWLAAIMPGFLGENGAMDARNQEAQRRGVPRATAFLAGAGGSVGEPVVVTKGDLAGRIGIVMTGAVGYSISPTMKGRDIVAVSGTAALNLLVTSVPVVGLGESGLVVAGELPGDEPVTANAILMETGLRHQREAYPTGSFPPLSFAEIGLCVGQRAIQQYVVHHDGASDEGANIRGVHAQIGALREYAQTNQSCY